ncbi:MAG: hypothetical protein IPK64_01125 [bacterium]|nr:hypothetical protein [bacterium]
MKRILLVVAMLSLAGTASAVMDVPSGGWDQALNITANTTIDLSQAITGTWDTQPAGYVAGKGIYDPEKWAIVFHYTSVTVASGVTLKFTNHPANPPVVWLVEGAVLINGVVNLNGQYMNDGVNGEAIGGPGGFKGGRRGTADGGNGGGFGPGGGTRAAANGQNAGGGGYGTAGGSTSVPGGATYGNVAILPLIGGSGGGGTYVRNGGGGGGGAILVAAQLSIGVVGQLTAIGGGCQTSGGSGSGGAIRLIAPEVHCSGSILATGGPTTGGVGGKGRIRIEANLQDLNGYLDPATASVVDPGDTPLFWPESSTPMVRVVSLNGIPVPSDPRGSLVYPHHDTFLSGAGDVTTVLEAANFPIDGTLEVYIVKQGGARTQLPTSSVTLIGGSSALSTWQAVFPAVNNGMYAIQARAVLPNP